MAYQIYTASLLKEGLVTYLCLGTDGAFWSTDINKATRMDEQHLHILKAEAEYAAQANIVVGPYPITVTSNDQGLIPVEGREKIRAFGPTITLPSDPVRPASDLHAA